MTQRNELDPRYMSTVGLNPFPSTVSPSRLVMFCGHIGQALVIVGANASRITTGAEREYGKYTFKIKMPCDAKIIKIIERYPQTLGSGRIADNPQSTVIYENAETGEYGIVSLVKYKSNHQHFGFAYRYNDNANLLAPGQDIAKGTVIADSPNVKSNGDYHYGISVPVALMSTPGIIEDGVEVADSLLPKMISKAYETHVLSFGKKGFPLNIHGDLETYKICPDIGERVGDDGLLFAWRKYNPLLAPIQMSPTTTMKDRLDPVFDKKVYVRRNARVIDIKVFHERKSNISAMPVGITAQLEKYRNAQQRYCDVLIGEYEALSRKLGKKLKITPEFEQTLVQAYAYSGKLDDQRVQRTYRADPLDEWRVEVTIEYDVIPTIGFKLTGRYGDKGVICNIRKEEDMPIDVLGNRALVIMDANSTIKRMNIGRLYEQWINAASRELANEIRVRWSTDQSPEQVETLWQRIIRYYQICSPLMYDTITGPNYTQSHLTHVLNVVRDGIHLRMMTDNQPELVDIVEQIRAEYMPCFQPITYRGNSGRLVTTIKPILIGDMYLMLLEKTGMDWSGVASAKRNHFGITAKLTNADKNSEPGRAQPVREWGEAETRLGSAATDALDGNPIAEMIDLSSNPASHRAVCRSIMYANKPTAIHRIIDRNEIPLGNHRALQFINHMNECAGFKFVKKD